MRKKIIAGNWKMNTILAEATDLAKAISSGINPEKSTVIFFPPFPFLQNVREVIANASNFSIGAQNLSSKEGGAYTGEVSAKMLTSIDMEYVLVGHSERREYFNEGDTILLEKLNQSFENGLKPIFCCGEPLGERASGNHVQYIGDQIRNVLFLLTPQQLNSTIIAYEPIWAIGTGQTASPEQAQEMHLLIRDVLKEKFELEMVEGISILYGGSVNAGNALSIFGQKDVDGGLVGGASLKVNDFLDIIKAMESIG